MSTYAKCQWCGRTFEKSGWNQFASHNTFGIAGKESYCSTRCKKEAEANSGGGNEQSDSNRGSSSGGGGGFLGSVLSSNAIKNAAEMSLSPEQLQAKAEVEARRRKEVEESDKQFIDSTKKLFGSTLSKVMPGKFTDKAKEAKELHLKLQDVEVDIKICLAKNSIGQALELIKSLKHDSSYLVDGTTTSYSVYWEEKRQNYLNNATSNPNIERSSYAPTQNINVDAHTSVNTQDQNSVKQVLFCSSCGTKIENANAKFCQSCGAKL